MSKGKTKEYSNDEITVIWKPDLCIHSAECVKGSPEVFKPEERPWIQIENSDSKQIMQTIDKCPSGALSYRTENSEESETQDNGKITIKATKNGPFLIKGVVEIEDSTGEIKLSKGKTTALCRCGASANKPFCDGSHTGVEFKG
jgi:uncharacterized Fe-S cluster protein YjdI